VTVIYNTYIPHIFFLFYFDFSISHSFYGPDPIFYFDFLSVSLDRHKFQLLESEGFCYGSGRYLC
jgi:hypothetical protein